MQPDVSLDSSAVALAGLGFFFAAIVLLWIFAFRRASSVTLTNGKPQDQPQDQPQPEGQEIRPVVVPIAGALDGGAPLPRVMLVAPRAERPTVREMVMKTPPPSEVPEVPDETEEPDIATQRTRLLPKFEIIINARGERIAIARALPPKLLPHEWMN